MFSDLIGSVRLVVEARTKEQQDRGLKRMADTTKAWAKMPRGNSDFSDHETRKKTVKSARAWAKAGRGDRLKSRAKRINQPPSSKETRRPIGAMSRSLQLKGDLRSRASGSFPKMFKGKPLPIPKAKKEDRGEAFARSVTGVSEGRSKAQQARGQAAAAKKVPYDWNRSASPSRVQRARDRGGREATKKTSDRAQIAMGPKSPEGKGIKYFKRARSLASFKKKPRTASQEFHRYRQDVLDRARHDARGSRR